MKKLLLITQNYYPEIGSHANRMKNIRSLLNSDKIKVTVLTTEPSYPNRSLYQDNSFWLDNEFNNDVIRVKTKVRKYTRNMFNRLMLYLEVTFKFILILLGLERKFDYIFVTSPPIFMGIAGIVAKKKLKKPLILDIRDLWPESLLGVGVFTFKPFLKLAYYIEKKIYQNADQIVINSESFRMYIHQKGIPENKIHFIPNSLNKDELNTNIPEQNSQIGKITVIYAGNIGLAQDIEKLVEVADLLKENKQIVFKVIGYGYKCKSVEKMIFERKLINISLLKPINREKTLEEVAKAEIAYVSLVDKEVFESVMPGKLMDYMCLKKPIIGDVSGYSKNIIEEAACGLVSETRKIDDLAELIEKLASSETDRKIYGNNGYMFAQNNLNWDKNIKVLKNLLEEFNEKESMHVRVESLHK